MTCHYCGASQAEHHKEYCQFHDPMAFDMRPGAINFCPAPPKFVPVADPVNHPSHYTSHPSGVECIQITEHMGFNLGNAVKYLWRADEKGAAIQDLEKAAWYIQREIAKRKKAAA